MQTIVRTVVLLVLAASVAGFISFSTLSSVAFGFMFASKSLTASPFAI